MQDCRISSVNALEIPLPQSCTKPSIVKYAHSDAVLCSSVLTHLPKGCFTHIGAITDCPSSNEATIKNDMGKIDLYPTRYAQYIVNWEYKLWNIMQAVSWEFKYMWCLGSRGVSEIGHQRVCGSCAGVFGHHRFFNWEDDNRSDENKRWIYKDV